MPTPALHESGTASGMPDAEAFFAFGSVDELLASYPGLRALLGGARAESVPPEEPASLAEPRPASITEPTQPRKPQVVEQLRSKETKPRFRERVGRKLGGWVTKAAVITTTAVALFQQHGLDVDHSTHAPQPSIAAELQKTPALFLPMTETGTIRTDELTIADLLPDPVSQNPSVTVASESSSHDSEQAGNRYQTHARQTSDQLMKLIQPDSAGNLWLNSGFDRNAHEAYTWEQAIALHGASRYNQAFPGGALSSADITALVRRYWDGNPASRGYTVTTKGLGDPESERYTDDGNWNAMLRLMQFAYQVKRGETPNDPTVFADAQTMLDINIQQFDPKTGLVRWKSKYAPADRDHNFTTISTASAVELALLLNQLAPYDQAQHQKNLQFAINAYESTRRTMYDPADGLYFDGCSQNGTVDTRKFAYNSGIMISDGMWLYQTTRDPKYLAQAEETASNALKVWDTTNLQAQDPTLAVVYLDRLYNLALVTEKPDLRAKILDSITSYADWYGTITLDDFPYLKDQLQYGWADYAPNKRMNLDMFVGSQLHAASLAALAEDQKNAVKNSDGMTSSTVPAQTTVLAAGGHNDRQKKGIA